MTMIKKINYLVAILFFATFFSGSVYSQSDNFKTGKSLSVQYNLLKTLQSQYVDSIDIEKLITTGVHSFLETLDPYTVYIPEEEEDEIEMMTTASYGGVGAVIRKHDEGIMVVQPYKNTPSAKMGMVPGDLILQINDKSAKGLEVADASAMMKGVPGTKLKLIIKKVRTKDTVEVVLKRERVHLSDLIYAGILRDSVAYIQMASFTLDGYKDVKQALEKMKETGNIKKILLDLRSNPGGLMSEAVDIVSLFVEKGTKVVSAKGRGGEMLAEYATSKDPIDLDTPLMVLVNSGSASSSEIVAGALQDLDRATIMGTRTFGKGLIQSIRDLGYGASLKVTTAKYYTPSGRCVQAIDYSHRNEDGSVGNVPDSLKKEFKTLKGRSVYDGGGIAPDVEIATKIYSRPLVALIYSVILEDYAIKYFGENDSIASPSEFSLTDEEYADFVKFAADKKFDTRTDALIDMEDLIASAKREGIYDSMSDQLESLKEELSFTCEEFLEREKAEVKYLVERDIVTKYYYREGGAELAIRFDAQVYKALDAWK